SPVMTDVQITFDLDAVKAEDGKPVNRVYPAGSFDLFAGEQLVVVGRYKKPGTAKVVVSGKVGEKQQQFDFPAKLVDKSQDETHAFIEKLWAVRRVGEILDELDLKGTNDELVKELVTLSTRHGILTPYTSFMADENAPVRDLAAATRQAGSRLGALNTTDGRGGFAQRAYKGSLKRADRAPAAPAAEMAADAAEALSSVPASRPRPGGRPNGQAGMGSSMGRNSSGYATGPALAEKAKKEAKDAGKVIRSIGSRTFYFRSGQWVDSQVTADQEKAPTRVKQFSDRYFDLARLHGKKMSQYMVFDEPVLLTLDKQAYLIEP
ncbi:MAG: hypothetical protein HQ567_34910, partial [Candidatus Nealsonbacteria bacterium]|nr:hypothetical protein [Candidatus Nealsonbacteria bacterium]